MVLDNTRARARNVITSVTETGLGTYFGYAILLYLTIDFIVLIINLIMYKGDGGCAMDGWVTMGPISNIGSNDKCSNDDSEDKDCKADLGRWGVYKTNNDDGHKTSLCKNEVDRLVKATIENNIVGGYTSIELLSYVIVPVVTIFGIVWGLISTRLSKAEWTFWILIATLIFTSLSSIAYNTDLNIIPEETSPLSYITDKLNLSGTDELRYSFIARRAKDGKECLVDGIMLGSGITVEGDPPTYSGFCDSESLPL